MEKYWKFYSQVIFSLMMFGHKFDADMKNQIISSAGLIVRSFEFGTLSPINKVYILLLTSFAAYIQTSEVQTLQFLNDIEKYSLLATLNKNS
jgi:hypothetical protein